MRVSTELVDARSDNTIWADSYDRDLTNIFAIQSEIAQTVASRLSARLSAKERKDIEEKPTNNLEAYDLYLQAKQLLGPNSVVVLWNSEKEALVTSLSPPVRLQPVSEGARYLKPRNFEVRVGFYWCCKKSRTPRPKRP